MNKNKKGFTLIELLIVIAIIAILAAIAIPQFAGMLGRARDSAIKVEMNGLPTAMVMHKIDHGNLTYFCVSPFVVEVKSTIQGTGIDAADITCVEKTPNFVIVSSALHTGGGWVVDSTGHTGMEASRIGLVGEWKFEGNANDTSGLGNDGTRYPLADPPTFVDGALSFDGVNDYVDSAASIAQDGTATFEVWLYFKNRAKDRGTFMLLYSHIYQHNANNFFYFGGTNDFISWVPSLNTWYHFVITYDGDTTTAKAYVNGVARSIANQAGPNTIQGWGGTISNSAHAFDGLIDEVRIYNRVLSAAEIKAQFEAGR